jgi:hypothetical protein
VALFRSVVRGVRLVEPASPCSRRGGRTCDKREGARRSVSGRLGTPRPVFFLGSSTGVTSNPRGSGLEPYWRGVTSAVMSPEPGGAADHGEVVGMVGVEARPS